MFRHPFFPNYLMGWLRGVFAKSMWPFSRSGPSDFSHRNVATYFSSLCSPAKKYKIVPHTRPLRSPSVGPNVLGVVQLNGHPRGAPRHRPRPRAPLPKPHHFEDNYDEELPYVSPLKDADYNGMSQIVSILVLKRHLLYHLKLIF